MAEGEWYKSALWKVDIPLKDTTFISATEDIKLNNYIFSLAVSMLKEEVGYWKQRKTVLLPKIMLKYKPIEQTKYEASNVRWEVNFLDPADKKEAITYYNLQELDSDKSELQLCNEWSVDRLKWIAEDGEPPCLLTVRITLKSPLYMSKPHIPMPTFSEEWDQSDVVFLVEEKEVHAHRQVLSLFSPVFKAMLHSEFKEKDSVRIELPGKNHSDLLNFMRMLYNKHELSDLGTETALRLVHLFHEYQVTVLEERTQTFLLKTLNDESALKCLEVGILYGYERLNQQALRVLAQHSLAWLLRKSSFLAATDELRLMVQEARIRYLETK